MGIGIKYEDLAYTAFNGFASVGSNNGKNGTSGLPFYKSPTTVVDFAHRAWVDKSKLHILLSLTLHRLFRTFQAGERLTKAFYGSPHSKSYYLGCSLGGRQGIGSAIRNPAFFDGIIAGAPGVDFNNLISWRARFFTITGAVDSPGFISSTAWKTWIHEEVLRQCDGLDGVEDGIVEEPSLCLFDPEVLRCRENGTEECLLDNQVEQMKSIYNDYRYKDRDLIFPAMQPGSEISAADRLYAGVPFAYSEVSNIQTNQPYEHH